MAISFDNIPSNIRVPLAYVEFNNTRAVQGTPQISYKLLVLGQMLATGTATAAEPVRITSADQAEQLFGRGSMLAEMFRALKAANRYTESWAIPLEEDAAGNAAAGAITVSGPATGSGTLNLYIAGIRVRVGVTSGQAASAIASAVAAAINADTRLPVTAEVDSGETAKVNLTCRWKGETGNDIDIRANYYAGEVLPAGVGLTITAMAGGSGNPDIADAITAMGDEWYHAIVMPYTDSANLTALEAELADRFGPLRQIDGMAYAAFRGDHSATSTFGASRNCPHVTYMGTGLSPQPPYIWAAVNAGEAAASLSIDPARPLQTLPLTGILPPALTARWTMEERNLLLFDGISTFTVDASGQVLIERQITNYKTNAFGVADPSYLDVNTPATLSYLRFAIRARITQKFPRHKLADDGTNFAPGQAIVTPRIIRAELVALMREMEEAGLVENIEQFKNDLLVERNANDRNRVDVLASPDLVNQFRIFAAQLQFIV